MVMQHSAFEGETWGQAQWRRMRWFQGEMRPAVDGRSFWHVCCTAETREKIAGRPTNAVRRRLGFDVASRKRSVLRGLQDIGARSVRNERIERARAPIAVERIALRSLLARPDRRDLVRRRFCSGARDLGR